MVQRAMWQGTANKSAAQVREAVAALGGDIKFAQGREHQSVSLNVMKQHVPKAVELLSEVYNNPAFTEAGVDAARTECLDVMKDGENCLFSQVQGNLWGQAFESTRHDGSGAGLGLNPHGLGTVVKTVEADALKEFHSQYLQNADTMALVVTGDVDAESAQEAANTGFGHLTGKGDTAQDKRYTGGATRVDAGKPSAPFANHVSLAWEVCGADGADSVPLKILLEKFGKYDRFQNDMTSNPWIRMNIERNSTQLGNMPLEFVTPVFEQVSDTGLMGFYFTTMTGAERNESWHFMTALQNEWVRYCMRLTAYDVEVGKHLLKNNLVFNYDGAAKANATIGKDLVMAGEHAPIEQQYSRINDVTVQQVSDTMNHYYYDREPVQSSWGVYYTLPVWNQARRNMYKWRY